MKNLVLPPTDVVGPHGASSKEKAILAIHPLLAGRALPLGRAPALPGGAFWLFHVTDQNFSRIFLSDLRPSVVPGPHLLIETGHLEHPVIPMTRANDLETNGKSLPC